MGLMTFLKGLFGGNSTPDIEEEPLVLPPARAPTPAPAPAPVPAPPPAPPPPPKFKLATRTPTTIDFPAVLKRAGVDVDQQQRVKKAQDLLRSLPEDSPAQLKRQIVEAAFTAFDVPTQKIIDAATAEVEALEAFVRAGGVAVQQIIDEGTARIAELEAEIAEIRASMATEVADQSVRDKATEAQINGVKPILAFFAQTNPGGVKPVVPQPSQPQPAAMFGQAQTREPGPFFGQPRDPGPFFTSNAKDDGGFSLTDDVDLEEE